MVGLALGVVGGHDDGAVCEEEGAAGARRKPRVAPPHHLCTATAADIKVAAGAPGLKLRDYSARALTKCGLSAFTWFEISTGDDQVDQFRPSE